MKKVFKALIELLPGESALAILNWLRRLWYPQVRRQHQLDNIVFNKIGRPGQILIGPFKGMKYVSAAYFSTVIPKILGTYELELAGPVEKICAAQPDVIVDIGAAEGYYAVGMTLRNPQAKTICFEMYKPAHSLLHKLAEMNGTVDRMSFRGFCEIDSLKEALESARRPAVICDCEGGEEKLLDPSAVAKLKSAMILVELHDEYASGICDTIRRRFSASHDVQVIDGRDRRPEDLPIEVPLSKEEFHAATYERFTKAQWCFLVPRTAPSA
jgi:hypothetical protein